MLSGFSLNHLGFKLTAGQTKSIGPTSCGFRRNLTGCFEGPLLRSVDYDLKFPTVDDWWELAAAYPEFRRPSLTPLKDYGYLVALRNIDCRHPKRVLEFGHGLQHSGDTALYSRGEKFEFWAADDYQGLYYYPKESEWLKAYAEYTR